MQKTLTKLSINYGLNYITDKLLKLNSPLGLKIGFLGEFSSGKSTLINALINQKILPSMDKPTSKSVIEIVAKDNIDKVEFYKLNKDKKEPISAIEFSKIALEQGDSTALINVTSNDFFQDGYMMIDTPGISSLDASDTDITYGYLPFLDCAVICNHIQKGSLTQSIINFLLKDEIRPIVNNILFVITNAHGKSPKAQEKIKEEIVSQLTALNKIDNLGIKDIESKVIVVSALEAMNSEKGFSLDELKESFSQNFMSKKVLLQEQRKSREIEKISNELLEALNFKKENSKLDLSSLKEKEEEFDKKISILEQKKSKIVQSLDNIDTKIQERIYKIFTKYIPQIKTLKDKEQTKLLINEIQEVIAKEIEKIISLHFEELSISNENLTQFTELETTIQNLLKQIDMGKDIGMVVLIELLTLGTAGVAGVFAFFLRSTSKMIMNQKEESNLKDTATFISQVNPIETIGDMIGSKLIENQILEKLEELSKNIATEIKDEIEIKIEEEVFNDLEEKLLQSQHTLSKLYKEKSEKVEEFKELNRQLDNDILKLQSMKKV
ncbi:Putative ATP /GTP binding protein [hydrothermal vent metagenome]|uniref:Putative ATP /GTP binding protein n=1 Tax=hydrothermal vent metagenome TaxID=652676 RepID=A0A1W1C1P9_9ZZZZ